MEIIYYQIILLGSFFLFSISLFLSFLHLHSLNLFSHSLSFAISLLLSHPILYTSLFLSLFWYIEQKYSLIYIFLGFFTTHYFSFFLSLKTTPDDRCDNWPEFQIPRGPSCRGHQVHCTFLGQLCGKKGTNSAKNTPKSSPIIALTSPCHAGTVHATKPRTVT